MSATATPPQTTGDAPVPRPPASKTVQRLVIGGGLAAALMAIGFAASYQADTDPSKPVLSGSAADGGGERPDDANATQQTLDVSPIEGWFPKSGEGSTCSEPVGVDLVSGYAANLIINGQTLTPDQLNNTQSAGRTLDQYTYGPEVDCPNGALLRPQNNVVQACVYRLIEGPETCELTQVFTFDAL
ncbi:MAG: hypothetical protein O3C27_02705 [Actinomycetota bacterium]|nr:hypothetical protein [Actinomycetota bacterium]